MANSEGFLMFSAETHPNDSMSKEVYLIIEYGSRGDAIKVSFRKIHDAFL